MAAEGDPWRSPAWMLLSAGKKATASSFVDGHEPGRATEENVRSWWRAASENRSEWLQIDLGQVFDRMTISTFHAPVGLWAAARPGILRSGI